VECGTEKRTDNAGNARKGGGERSVRVGRLELQARRKAAAKVFLGNCVEVVVRGASKAYCMAIGSGR
jgi:hypothetical protein